MVWSCMQLKGTMIVPLILVETVEEQNNKGELTCEKKLTAAAEWAEEAAYHSHRGRNLEYLSCSLLAVAADLLILGPIFNQISSFVLFLLCVGVCTCCAEFYYFFYPPPRNSGLIQRTSAPTLMSKIVGEWQKRYYTFVHVVRGGVRRWSTYVCMCLSGLFTAQEVHSTALKRVLTPKSNEHISLVAWSAVYSSELFWCELPSFEDIVCLPYITYNGTKWHPPWGA